MSADPWETTTGLLDDFDFDVKEAWFGTNDKIGEGKRMLLTLRGDAVTEDDEVEEDYELIYTVGDGWEAVKGGDAVKHRAGNGQFNNNSAIGRFIDSFKAIEGALDVLRERGNPTESKTWVGLKLHIKRQDFGSFTPPGETEPRRISVPVATALLNGETKAKPTRTRKPKEEAGEEKPKARTRTRKPKVKDLRDEVVEFAAEFDDHAEFADAVFDPDEFPRAAEVEDDEELSEDVLNEDGSVWTDSRE